MPYPYGSLGSSSSKLEPAGIQVNFDSICAHPDGYNLSNSRPPEYAVQLRHKNGLVKKLEQCGMCIQV